MPPAFGKVEDLQFGKSKFGMQLRLIRKYEVPEFRNPHQSFSLEAIFHDKTGSRIHATIQRALIAKFKPLLEEGKVYAVMEFIVGYNNMKYKTTSSQFKLMVFKNTRICEVADEDFPKQMFNFRSFEAITSTENDEGTLFDVIGVLASPYKTETKNVNGRTLRLCTITLEDQEGRTLSCTMWEDYASQLIHFLQGETESPIGIIIQFCRTNSFRGEVSITNSYCATNIIFTGSFQELQDIKEKYLENVDKSLRAAKTTILPFVVVQDDDFPLKTIAELQNDKKAGQFWVYACIYSLDSIGAWAYLACTVCFTKLRADNDKFFCEKCNSTDVAGRMRYKLTLRVVDDCGTAAFHLWDKECIALIGKSAADLNAVGELDDIPKEIEDLEGVKALFRVTVKEGESKYFSMALNVTKVICDPYEIEKFYESRAQRERYDEILMTEPSKGTLIQNGKINSSLNHASTSVQPANNANSGTQDPELEIPCKTISQIKHDGKIGHFWVYAEIVSIEDIGGLTYLLCTTCSSKLQTEGDTFFCQKCNSSDIEGRIRHKLTLQVTDQNGCATFKVWERECMQILGKTAEQIEEYGKINHLPIDIGDLVNKNALFKVQVKEGETKDFKGSYSVSKVISDGDEITKYCDYMPTKGSDETLMIEPSKETLIENEKDNSSLNPTSIIAEPANDEGEKEHEDAKANDELPTPQPKKKCRKLIKKEKN